MLQIQKTILVLGDSHTRALTLGLKLRTISSENLGGAVFDINWLMTKKGEKIRGNLRMEDAHEKASSLSGNDLLVLSIIGTFHNIFGLLQHDMPFDFIMSEDTSVMCQSGVQVIPVSVLYDFFLSVIERNSSILKLKKSCNCKVIHLATPPPKEDQAFIKEHAKRYRDKIIEDVGITPAHLRLKLWDIEMKILEKKCVEWGVELLRPPIQTIDSNGYLRREYYANDATHANAAYGELVLQQLESLLHQQSG